MTPIANRVIDVAAILLIPAVYAISAGRAYAEAVGFSLMGGLIGMLLFYLISRIPSVKALWAQQGSLRRYSIGCALFALVGVPTFMAQARADRASGEIRHAIGAAIGEAAAMCEASRHIRSRYCPGFTIPSDMENACATQFVSHLPQSIKDEATQTLQSQKLAEEMQAIRRQADQGFALGASKNVPLPELCLQYQQLAEGTYKRSIEKITSIGARLKE